MNIIDFNYQRGIRRFAIVVELQHQSKSMKAAVPTIAAVLGGAVAVGLMSFRRRDMSASDLNNFFTLLKSTSAGMLKKLGEILLEAAEEAEAMKRMRGIFNLVDQNGNGSIDESELKRFQEALGEPLSDAEIQAAFESMGGHTSKNVDFAAFAAWYERAISPGGRLYNKGQSYTKRFDRRASLKFNDMKSSFALSQLAARSVGPHNSLEFRVALDYGANQISPWHDVPLYPVGSGKESGIVHMVVEIPK